MGREPTTLAPRPGGAERGGFVPRVKAWRVAGRDVRVPADRAAAARRGRGRRARRAARRVLRLPPARGHRYVATRPLLPLLPLCWGDAVGCAASTDCGSGPVTVDIH